MLVKKLPILILLVVAANLSGQTKEFFIGKWLAHPHFEIYGMGFNNANNTVTCISDKRPEFYHFREDGILEISGSQYTVNTFVGDDKEVAEIMGIARAVQCRWTLDVERQCISLKWANNKRSVLIYSRLDSNTLLVTMQDIQDNGLPAPQFQVFVFVRQ